MQNCYLNMIVIKFGPTYRRHGSWQAEAAGFHEVPEAGVLITTLSLRTVGGLTQLSRA